VKSTDANGSVRGEDLPRCRESTEAWTLTGPDGLRIRVLALGATWASCRMPLATGARELLLGFESEADYSHQASYIGACIGRYCNRIAEGRLRGKDGLIQLAREPGATHHLHGGPEGFDQRRWQLVEHDADLLRLALTSPAGDQGYPGELDCEVGYRMLADGGVEVRFQARVSEPCPVNLTCHPYFNLDGNGDARGQHLQIAAESFLPVDALGIPHGALASVAGTGFDFRAERPIQWAQNADAIYDHAFLLDPRCVQIGFPAASLRSADGRVRMQIFTTLPALQLYTGQHLADGTRDCTSIWPDCSGIALEPQFLPDSPNHPEWPQPGCWLMPGQRYDHRIVYRFSAAL